MAARFHALLVDIDLHVPAARSLKAKRSAITPIVRHIDQLAGVGAAEIGHADTWQRSTIGVSAVGNSVSHVEQVIDGVERFVWSRPDVEVLEITRSWWDSER